MAPIPRVFTQDEVGKVRALYEGGRSIADVAKHLGLAIGAVRKIMKRNNISVRKGIWSEKQRKALDAGSRSPKRLHSIRKTWSEYRDAVGSNISGKIFGKLKVLRDVLDDGHFRWLCQCECGTVKSLRPQSLLTGSTKSCGCTGNKSMVKRPATSSRYKGVNYLSGTRGHGRRWVARIGGGKNRVYLGVFDHEESAALAYDEAARVTYGAMALTNSDMKLYPWQRTEPAAKAEPA